MCAAASPRKGLRACGFGIVSAVSFYSTTKFPAAHDFHLRGAGAGGFSAKNWQSLAKMVKTVDRHEDGEADNHPPCDCVHCWTPELALGYGELTLRDGSIYYCMYHRWYTFLQLPLSPYRTVLPCRRLVCP